jgi:hypothetical protein
VLGCVHEGLFNDVPAVAGDRRIDDEFSTLFSMANRRWVARQFWTPRKLSMRKIRNLS